MKDKKIKRELQSRIETTLKTAFPELQEAKTGKQKKSVRKATKALLAGLFVKPAKQKREKKPKTGKPAKNSPVAVLVEHPEVATAK